MSIEDLFSHKIHSSGDDWPYKLIDIASVFAEFDGAIYDRDAIEKRLSIISPRTSLVGRDPSKFRDEISAYPAYLGLYRVQLVDDKWHIFLSETAKQFLTCEEPNVEAFMLLQMVIFQYPNGMGAAYYSDSSNCRIQANTRDRTLGFIEAGIHLSPLRLICMALKADAELRQVNPLKAEVTIKEIFALANCSDINVRASPDISVVRTNLDSCRKGQLQAPAKYESRFHILRHTGFLITEAGSIRIRTAVGSTDAQELLLKFETINSISKQFRGFDSAENGDELLGAIKQCSWGQYFDGVRTLESEKVKILTNENPDIFNELEHDTRAHDSKDVVILKSDNIYELKEIDFTKVTGETSDTNRKKYTDPELTRIRRQRANLAHKDLLEKLHNHLQNRNVVPLENEHIDLFAEFPNNDKFLFEVKSITINNLLSQTRKGISQLYEYRFRYQTVIGYDVKLFLVFPREPAEIPWLQKYLSIDRKIGIIWFGEDGQMNIVSHDKQSIQPLIIENVG